MDQGLSIKLSNSQTWYRALSKPDPEVVMCQSQTVTRLIHEFIFQLFWSTETTISRVRRKRWDWTDSVDASETGVDEGQQKWVTQQMCNNNTSVTLHCSLSGKRDKTRALGQGASYCISLSRIQYVSICVWLTDSPGQLNFHLCAELKGKLIDWHNISTYLLHTF